ncbi:MAG: NAD kinase [Bacilli bacterium]|nr:NAD kinase [Bacilli bacterium]
MKVAVFQSDKHFDQKLRDLIYELTKKEGYEKDEKDPDIVFNVGGDGTYLRAIQNYLDKLDKITFINIKNGTLGFYYGFTLDDLPDVLRKFKNGELIISSYRLLQAEIVHQNMVESVYALNEIRIENPFHTLISNVLINDEQLETFRGNGLCVSSSLGSTAYNKSLGGAIIHPSVELLELTEIAPLSNNIYRSLGSSIILSENQKISLNGDFPHIILGYDHLSKEVKNPIEIRIFLSNLIIKTAYDKNYSYVDAVRRSFIK